MLTSIDNKIYGYSNEKIHADFFLYYNQDLIEEYNLEDPATLWNNGEWDWHTTDGIWSDVGQNGEGARINVGTGYEGGVRIRCVRDNKR